MGDLFNPLSFVFTQLSPQGDVAVFLQASDWIYQSKLRTLFDNVENYINLNISNLFYLYMF